MCIKLLLSMENLFITSENYTQNEVKMPRSLLLFENAIKSPVTKKSYRLSPNQFLAFVYYNFNKLASYLHITSKKFATGFLYVKSSNCVLIDSAITSPALPKSAFSTLLRYSGCS